ncbi:lysozyme [Nonomuraea thailandensis]|uniref:Lysozyme n=1 Tax=Nonomuraea thailandensis TaxID=1188745 RepID=A0A9X2GAL2_9ACTN|nr:glycoside hydrolase family 25 protein [Nonomuraea thailandensis]MCP2355487.1 lysozyme [Nonomuraea thailandensis]
MSPLWRGAILPILLTGALLPASPARATTGPGGYAVHGIDISGHNHPGEQPIDWRALAASGQKFVSIKATEGHRSKWVNPWFARDLAGARRVRLIRTAYHYFLHHQDGVAQADHFLSTVRGHGLDGTHPYELPLEVDVEGACGAEPAVLVKRVLAFIGRVESVTGVAPTVYTQRSFVDRCMAGSTALGRHRVRLARYGRTPPAPLPGATGWDFWQFTSSARVAGLPDHDVDENVFAGDLAALERLANLAP